MDLRDKLEEFVNTDLQLTIEAAEAANYPDARHRALAYKNVKKELLKILSSD